MVPTSSTKANSVPTDPFLPISGPGGVVGCIAHVHFFVDQIGRWALQFQASIDLFHYHGLLHTVQQDRQLEVVQVLVGGPLGHFALHLEEMVESLRENLPQNHGPKRDYFTWARVCDCQQPYRVLLRTLLG